MESIQDVYKAYEKLIFRYLYGLTLDFHLAEELTQETFFQAVKSFHKFRGDSHVSTWLFKIARNVYMQHCRKNPFFTVPIDETICKIPIHNGPEDDLVMKEKYKYLIDSLKQVPEKQREVLWLREWQELSYAEIAAITGRSVSWVKVNIHRGRIAFQKIYRKGGMADE